MLTTKRLRIEQTKIEHLEDYYSLASNVKAMYYCPQYFINDKSACKSLIDAQADNKYKYYSIFDKNKNEYLGQINYEVISTLNEYKLCKLSFFLKKEDESSVIEAFDGLLELMILHDSCIKIICEVIECDNYRNNILNKVGFVSDKKMEILFNNKMTNAIIYKITKPSYLKKKN